MLLSATTRRHRSRALTRGRFRWREGEDVRLAVSAASGGSAAVHATRISDQWKGSQALDRGSDPASEDQSMIKSGSGQILARIWYSFLIFAAPGFWQR
jgi:hypothetical protein